MTNYYIIKNAIEKEIKRGNKNFIIYPFGKNGLLTKNILSSVFNIKEQYIIDNYLTEHNEKIKSIDIIHKIDCSKYIFFITVENEEIKKELAESLTEFVPQKNKFICM